MLYEEFCYVRSDISTYCIARFLLIFSLILNQVFVLKALYHCKDELWKFFFKLPNNILIMTLNNLLRQHAFYFLIYFSCNTVKIV